jgi:hypothetical protein
MTRLALGARAYAVPTFALGYVWHLVAFRGTYEALAIYRGDIVIPFGLVAILIQGSVFAWVYEKAFAARGGAFWQRALVYAAVGAALSWSYTTLAVGAKHIMASVPDFLLIETAFTAAQWLLVGPLTALAFRQPLRIAQGGPERGRTSWGQTRKV